MAGGSQLQIQLPLSRLRTKLHPAALSHPFGENQDEPSLRLGRLVFISICRFGALRSVTCLVVLPGRSLREVPSQPGGRRGSPDPRVMGAGGGKGRLCPLCPILQQVAVWGRSGCLCQGSTQPALGGTGEYWEHCHGGVGCGIGDGGSAGAQSWMRLR